MNKFEQLTEIIQERRSIFPPMLTGEKVSDEVIMELLDNANWAPNHRKTEPWRFRIFKGEALQKLSDYLGDYYEKNTPPEKFSEKKLQKTREKPLMCSHIIAICMQRDPEESVPEWEELSAVACAVQNLWLSVTAKGLGGYWSSPGSILKADEFLGLKEGEKCYGLFYLGVPKPDIQLSGQRGDIKEKVTWQ
jgi:nitroreductase